jgi:hypothetical protein
MCPEMYRFANGTRIFHYYHAERHATPLIQICHNEYLIHYLYNVGEVHVSRLAALRSSPKVIFKMKLDLDHFDLELITKKIELVEFYS